MLYIQITQVMLRRPKRSGRTFWFIVLYASALFPLTTVAFAGKFKFTEDMFLALPKSQESAIGYTMLNAGAWPNVMSQIWYVILILRELSIPTAFKNYAALRSFHGLETF